MEFEIIHVPEQRMFKTEIEGRTAFVQYRLLNGCLDIIHTIVPVLWRVMELRLRL